MSDPTVFSVGITTLTNVDAISRLALDLRDMDDNLRQKDFVNARRIYNKGHNSPQYDTDGNELEDRLSLKGLSLAALGIDGNPGLFDEDPSFMFQILGLMNIGESLEEAIPKYATYADDFIAKQLENDESGDIAAQASAILTVQMYAIHQLWDGLMDCVAIQSGYNPEADQTGSVNPRQSFDNFIALWVGETQEAAPNFDGDMLYAHAQEAAVAFDTLDSEGEALVNSDIRGLYESMQRRLSEDDYCTQDAQIEEVWELVNRIIPKMYVPMVQMLIRSMYENDPEQIRMYALAIIPQFSQCRPSLYRKLKTYLLDKDYDESNFERIVSLLQQSYDCLGFSCQDVGAFREDKVAECAGYEEDHPMASFIPKENVRALSKIDLDILAIREMLEFPTTTKNMMAHFYYKFGRAAVANPDPIKFDVISLREMARSSYRETWSPYFQDYEEYHDQKYFADVAITEAFDGKGKWGAKHDDQRAAYIVSLLQFSVVVEYAMGLLGYTLQICGNDDLEDSPTLLWDSFAASYIGSLEGTESGGSRDTVDGVMLFGLSNRRAFQFDTLNEDRFSVVNDEMVDLLFAGQNELGKNDCNNHAKSVSRVMHLMLIPLIQSTIWYAILNSNLDHYSTDPDLAIGEVLAISVLPIVAKYDSESADAIQKNMVRVEGVHPVLDGPQAVANAFFQVLDDIGWGCEYVGQADGVDACDLYVPGAANEDNAGLFSHPRSVPIFACLIFSSFFLWV